MKARYLTFFSYIGTPFRSSEKIWLKEGKNYPDYESIQGLMEIALTKLRSLNYPNITLSSCTDGGVHALNATAHFDLERFGSGIYNPDQITQHFNKVFKKSNTSIFVKKCLRVPDNFSARFNAISRIYLYRLAVLREPLPDHHGLLSYIPVEEWSRCHFVSLPNFDIERFKEGANYFVGYHDFTTFKKFDKLTQNKHNRREINEFNVKVGHPMVTRYTQVENKLFDYWDIEIKGRAFVHNQIRRMIGTLLSVAIGKLPVEEVKVMLQVPSKHSWHSFIQNCPPVGLYLCDVKYNSQDLVYQAEGTKPADEIESDLDSESINKQERIQN